MVMDHKGYIWLATEDGLNRFNGYEFEVFRHSPLDSFSLPHNYLGDMFVDAQNRLFLTLQGSGSVIYTGRTFDPLRIANAACALAPPLFNKTVFQDTQKNIWFTVFDSVSSRGLARIFPDGKDTLYIHNPQNPNSLSHNHVDCFYQDENFIWFGTRHGLCRFNYKYDEIKTFEISTQFAAHRDANQIRQLVPDLSGRLLLGTRAGLFLFDPETESICRPQAIHRRNPAFVNAPIDQLLCDNAGDIWAISVKTCMLRLTSAGDVLLYGPENCDFFLPAERIMKIYEDAQGDLWLYSRTGLCLFDRKTNSFHTLRHHEHIPTSLSSSSIEKALDDGRGSLWIATLGNGLSRLDRYKNQFRVIQNFSGAPQKLPSNTVTEIFRDAQGRLLVAAPDSGVFLFDEKSQTSHAFFRQEKHGHAVDIRTIHQDRDGIFWFGAWQHGLVRYDDQRKKTTFFSPPDSLPENRTYRYVRQIVDDKNGNLWLATKNGGLFQFNKQTESITPIRPPDYADGNNAWIVLSLYLDANNILWIGGDENGLWRYDIKTGQFSVYRHSPENPNSISNNTVFDIFKDSRGRFWIATFHGGLNLFDPATGHFSVIRTRDGLPSDAVYSMWEDAAGFLWLNTNGGLCRCHPDTREIKTFSEHDGLPVNGPVLAYWQEKNGDFYLGARNGLFSFDPRQLKTNPHPPPVYLTGFFKSNTKVFSEYDLDHKDEIVLSYKDYVFSFEFVALNYINPLANQYAYKLEGLHQEWINCGSQRRATFSRVPPGTYTFRVQGANNDGVWNEQGASINVKITPPFWQTWWFRGTMICLVFGLMVGGFRLRLEHYRRIERIRVRIADDLHDEIGSNLGSISMMSQMIRDGHADKKKNSDFLTSIHHTAVKTAESMRDIVWFIHPENDSAERILLRMRDFAGRLLQNIEYTFVVEERAFTDRLDLNSKRNIYLIFKELLNNIVRHAHALQVNIRMHIRDGHLRLTVTDDGIGFDTTQQRSGVGLDSMHNRASEIGATLHFHSQPNHGTRTELIL